jgi:hypothetical protein
MLLPAGVRGQSINEIQLNFSLKPVERHLRFSYHNRDWQLLSFNLSDSSFYRNTSEPLFFITATSFLDYSKLSLKEFVRGLNFSIQSSNYDSFRQEGWKIDNYGMEIWIKIRGK